MKGVFCIEGFWFGDHRDKTSVYPVLDLVNRYTKMDFLYHRCATRSEFVYCIERWTQKGFHRKYPLLYLAFHGEEGLIKIGNEKVTLDDLADLLGSSCINVVIYFGSCATIKIDKRKIQTFMEKTKVVAVLGYKYDVNWLTSAAFEIRLLSYFQEHPFDSKGMEEIYSELKADCNKYMRELDFEFIKNEREHFPRKRKTAKKVSS